MQGKLSIVATPIGNLEDITLRAIRVLSEVDYILCEDTRVTGKLLKRHEINTPMKRYDAHTSEATHQRVIEDLKEGKNIALVSDAGTPGVSDPGVLLVSRVRKEGGSASDTIQKVGLTKSNLEVEVVPGPSAVTAAFSIAGIPGNQFAFLGFVPNKKGRQTFFRSLEAYEMPVIFFESTHRIMKTLEALQNLSIDGKVLVARELTKLHEEVVSGTPAEVLQYFENNSVKQKGEFVVIVQ